MKEFISAIRKLSVDMCVSQIFLILGVDHWAGRIRYIPNITIKTE